ncbi:MAG TPA: ATP-binding protein [Puia sp.]|nr:ATP-binding protein [Puia sp.]
MIKRVLKVLLLVLLMNYGKAQQLHVDSLRREIDNAQNDTVKIILYDQIIDAYLEINPDSSVYFAEKQLVLTRKLNLRLNEAGALHELGYALTNLGDHPRALQRLLSAVAIDEDPNTEQRILPDKYLDLTVFLKRPVTSQMLRLSDLATDDHILGILYNNTFDTVQSKSHFLQALRLAGQSGYVKVLVNTNITLGRLYLSLRKLDSALLCEQKAYDLSIQTGYKKYLGSILLNLGRIKSASGDKGMAAAFFRRAIAVSIEQDYLRGVAAGNLYLADLSNQSGQKDSSLHFLRIAMQVAQSLNDPNLLSRSYRAINEYFRQTGNNDSSVKYQELIIKTDDSLFSLRRAQQFKNLDLDEQQRQQQLEAARLAYRNKFWIYLLVVSGTIFFLAAIILWKNNRQRKIANTSLSLQKEELQSTLTTLRATQKQLITSEKMASLGELTAGIAHEIQNPLNFMNNFSEVNAELIDEASRAIKTGDQNEALELISNLRENELKINHHGKRADAIVKGMLQHSRSSAGQKEPTDINALADEYLRLAYHGLRAKDNSFNATIKTDFDAAIGKINIIQQDIGRVLLNLYNNGFYAVNEREKQQPEGYEPTVSVSTKRLGDQVEIRVKDNGTGIPQKVIDKIFQPFFTTKPTGQGTGLGLSLSYDIVKAHGGEISVNTKEGEFTEFVIQLPTSQLQTSIMAATRMR